VGDLSVLDALSAIAPVVAVSGNDEPPHIKEVLPLRQVLAVNGRRIVLLHSHYPDPVEERASRKEHRWEPKLDRLAGLGRAAGASLVVYGHTHVPMRAEHAGLTLFNPGALAAGSYFTRQKHMLVGRLDVAAHGALSVQHYDALTGLPAKVPAFDPRIEFGLMVQQYQTSIVEPSLLADVDGFSRIKYENARGVVAAVAPLYRRCLTENEPMRRADLVAAIEAGSEITPHDRAAVLAAIVRAADETMPRI
jgi:predicted phosphodiesterase